ncbi:hypothetical protein [Methylobacterium sp. Leaf466]|uniref:hypothetical protein n=1 Tax=Methylobacterium sp. Leaf466 TaxID=1736386 RepID=UPI0006F7CCF5|nr:hypothetical protein [Methylobacterium sp. Leaf466]KQT90363.1 hypothetical protein ASG59_00735 [Methylobacterium sp. Leaf466]
MVTSISVVGTLPYALEKVEEFCLVNTGGLAPLHRMGASQTAFEQHRARGMMRGCCQTNSWWFSIADRIDPALQYRDGELAVVAVISVLVTNDLVLEVVGVLDLAQVDVNAVAQAEDDLPRFLGDGSMDGAQPVLREVFLGRGPRTAHQ